MSKNRILGFGCTGPDVVNLQLLLNHHLGLPRQPLAPDGTFGPLTRARVIEFQTLNRLWPAQMSSPPEANGLPRKPLVIDGIAQAIVNISLRDGTCSAPSGQFLLGASYTFSR